MMKQSEVVSTVVTDKREVLGIIEAWIYRAQRMWQEGRRGELQVFVALSDRCM